MFVILICYISLLYYDKYTLIICFIIVLQLFYTINVDFMVFDYVLEITINYL